MAKYKEELSWAGLDVSTFPKHLQELDAELREAFAGIKEIKSRYEPAMDKVLQTIAPALDDDTKAILKVGKDGKFPAGTVRKFSYMRGVAVATAMAAKGKASGGIALS